MPIVSKNPTACCTEQCPDSPSPDGLVPQYVTVQLPSISTFSPPPPCTSCEQFGGKIRLEFMGDDLACGWGKVVDVESCPDVTQCSIAAFIGKIGDDVLLAVDWSFHDLYTSSNYEWGKNISKVGFDCFHFSEELPCNFGTTSELSCFIADPESTTVTLSAG